MATEMNVEAERAAFEAWARNIDHGYASFNGTRVPGNWYYFENDAQAAWAAWQASAARRAAQPADVGAGELPELPEPKYAADDLTDIYTADQMRQYARDAIAADRRRPKREMPPELKAEIEAAHKTHATGALLSDGSAVFINYGDQPQDTSHLECTACGGSGHIDDQRLIAGRLGEESPQATQGEPVYFYRQRHTGLNWIETDRDPRALFAGTPMDLCMEYRTLYAAPPLSSEPQAEKGAGACGS